LELKHLRSFVKVAQLLSFSRAARQLHLSQPALSTQIKLLETDLGVRLLDRNRRTVRLTPAGQALLVDAANLLQQVADTEQRVAKIASGDTGHLRIGFVASATAEIVPAIVLAFRKKYPGVSLDLKNMPTSQQVGALRSGILDAGFVRMPLQEEDLTVSLIHREPFAIVLAKNHPLAREKNLYVRHLAREPFVAYGHSWAPSFYESWTGICRRAGFTPAVVQETGEMETALALVAAGLGVAILPEGMARRHHRVFHIKTLQQEKTYSEIGIATLREGRTPLLDHLVLTARQFAPVMQTRSGR
jgi:LysR family transcriptional regulator, benzoate and cis,cis-muconate-responsive activator of ben and cat genes